MRTRLFHWTTICQGDNLTDKNFLPPKNKIPSGGISQIDALEAVKITYEDSSLLVVRKCVEYSCLLDKWLSNGTACHQSHFSKITGQWVGKLQTDWLFY